MFTCGPIKKPDPAWFNDNVCHHPFQKGTVVRKRDKWLTIALEREYCLLCERVEDEQGSDVFGRIREGDRLYTDAALLQTAIQSRVQFNAHGLIKRE